MANSRRRLRRAAIGASFVLTAALCGAANLDGRPQASRSQAPALGVAVSDDAAYLINWIGSRADNAGLPFAIVDKKQARMFLYDGQQRLLGSSVILLGASAGDLSAPGVGQRAQLAQVHADERTTPAGRFQSEPGRNLNGEDIVWVDYGAALAIHRLRPDAALKERTRRLVSATPDDNRTSLGCVVVPLDFYESWVRPWLGAQRGLVYILPDSGSVQAWWPNGADGDSLAQSD